VTATDISHLLSGPETKAGRLQREVLKVVREHEADGALPTSGRFVWYELVTRGVVDKTKSRGHDGVKRGVDQDVAVALKHLRDQGIVPWWWIEDETRSVYRYDGSCSIRDGVLDLLEQVSIDPWDGQAPLVLTESRSLAGVLRPVASEYGIDLAPTNGQVGGFLHTDVVPLLRDGRRVLYLGDLDLSGAQIEANTRKVLSDARVDADGRRYFVSDWQRLALTEAQVDIYGLHDLVITKMDRRYKPHREHAAIETEALSQRVIVDILRTALDELLPQPLADVQVREEAQRDLIRQALVEVTA